MKLVLIRHGQTRWNREQRLQGWQDSELTQYAQLQLMTMPLPTLTNPIVICSDLGRAIQSAEIIATRYLTGFRLDQRLRERGFGVLEGKEIEDGNVIEEEKGVEGKAIAEGKISEIRAVLDGVDQYSHEGSSALWRAYHQRYLQPLGGRFGVELEQVFEDRILSFLDDVCTGKLDRDIVVISHGEWIRACQNLLAGTPSWHVGKGIERNSTPIVHDFSNIVDANKRVTQ
ncbi:histidine phosphatase family protein [Thaumasiovibrio sp. DFM-14]|uniref:histidine phosphatase family protein n=1 Tax=Thaumasiovibrio sp. DFM-14 TaxID=3384792 RepID=UPI0039A08589